MSSLTDDSTFELVMIDDEDDEVADEADEEPLQAAFWRKKDHPRGPDGQFIDKNVDSSTTSRFSTALRGKAAGKAVPSSNRGRSGMHYTPAESAAANVYQTPAFMPINVGLRVGKGSPKKIKAGADRSAAELTDVVTNLDSIMARSKITDDIVVHRGIRNPEVVFGKLWSDDVTGLSWREFGFSSTAIDDRYPRQYAGSDNGVVMNIMVPKGTGATLLEQNLGDSDDITQVLLDRNVRYRVINDHGVDKYGVRVLDVEVS